jgi:hypothetical protein
LIGKKVMNSKGGHSKAARIGSLLDYIRVPQTALSEERCVHYGGQGFLTASTGGHRAEMIALAQDAVRSADPVNHYILSWREGEVPALDQVDHAVTLLVDELGLRGHQLVYGLHADTDNMHLHVVVNRVHPDTLRVIKINGGFDLEALHRAVARIEHAQGWQPEQRARYQVSLTGQVERSPAEQARSPEQSKTDREAHCGIQSAERRAIEQAAPVIAAAASWESLHTGLAAVGMRYERTGSGAKVFVGDTPLKASSVARSASFANLQKRLGPYRPAPVGLHTSTPEVRPVGPELPGWRQYNEQRAWHYLAKRGAWEELRLRLRHERGALRDRQRDRRERLLRGSFLGRGVLLNVLRVQLAQEQHRERDAQRQQHAVAREELRARYPGFPGIEQWLRNQGHHEIAEQWRYRECASQGPLRGGVRATPTARLHARVSAGAHAKEDLRRASLEHAWS